MKTDKFKDTYQRWRDAALQLQAAEGWSDKETAEALGLTLEEYEGDNAAWSATALRVLSNELNISCEYMLGRTERKRPRNVADEIEKSLDDATAKLQLLTELFDAEADINLCHEGLQYVVDGIGHDLGNIYEALKHIDRSKLAQY